ncbi:hypothetical protein EDB89DRAFT_1915670 [Lactarius sanguifluus]|nr:hypothetical protein EDB89DRAFT_1915670 [Lactarius sanguifluus]
MRYRWIPVFFLLSTVPLGGIATSHWDDMRSKHSWKTIPGELGVPGPPASRHHDRSLHRCSSPTAGMPYDTWRQFSDRHRVVQFPKPTDLLGASYQLYTHTKTNETDYLHTWVLASCSATWACTDCGTYDVLFLPSHCSCRHRASAPAWQQLGLGKPSSRDGILLLNVTPAFLRWLYNTVTYVPSAMDRNMVGVTGYGEEYPSPADLTSYMHKFRPDGIDATYTVASINGGGYDPNNPGGEANADLQLSEGVAYPTPAHFLQHKGFAERRCLPFLVGRRPQPAERPANDHHIVWHERDVLPDRLCDTSSARVAPVFSSQAVTTVSAKVTAPPDSLLSSPQPAVHKRRSLRHGRWRNDELQARGRSQPVRWRFLGILSAPWGTSSRRCPTFLDNLGQQYSGLYNPFGRGIPDIAAQAKKVPVFQQWKGGDRGRNKLLNASASLLPPSSMRRPSSSVTLTAKVQIVAGIISLVNDYQISRGKRPLGFLNPWLYGGGLNGLNDIVSGSNPGCNTDGFSAVVGWDPVTGLGTPDFWQIMHILDPGYAFPPE